MISVVDDDPSVCRALKRLLRSHGYEVRTFPSAQDFLAWEPHKKMECLILDIHMDGMDGFELQQRLIKEDCNLPIIFITAHDDDRTRLQANRSGSVAYLPKPFDDEYLIAAIEKATGN